MCNTCHRINCSGYPCRYNSPNYNPPYRAPFVNACLPVIPPAPPYFNPCGCGQTTPCSQSGCISKPLSDCVIVANPLACLETSAGSTLTLILQAIDNRLCSLTPPACQVKVSEDDECCAYLADKITSSSLVITTVTDDETGCQTLNIEDASSGVQTIYLNQNQDGTNRYSVPLPSQFVTGDVIADFDGRLLNSVSSAAPTFDFNIKGNRTVFVDTNLFAKYDYDTTSTLGVYTITPPKHYLGNTLNALNYEELVYETEIVYNCNAEVIPAPSSQYDTTVSYYINGFGGVIVNPWPISTPFKVFTQSIVRRLTNTTAVIIHKLKIQPGIVATSLPGGVFQGYDFGSISLVVYGTFPIVTSLDVDMLTYKIVAQTVTSNLGGLQFQVLDSKITLNKF